MPEVISGNLPETLPENEPVTKKHIWKGIKYFADKGLDTAVKHIWTLIGGGAMTVLTTLAFYLWGAAWLYPYLIYGFVFASGIFVAAFMVFCLTVLRIRNEKALERARLDGFISSEKGLFDHDADFEKARNKFSLVVGRIGNYLGLIADTVANSDYESWSQMSPEQRLKSASKIAASILKHSKAMETHTKELTDVINTIEVSGTVVFMQASYEPSKINELRESLVGLFTRTQSSIESMVIYRDSQVNVKGLSKDLDSAMNHLIYVTTENIETLKRAETIWLQMGVMLDVREEQIKQNPPQ